MALVAAAVLVAKGQAMAFLPDRATQVALAVVARLAALMLEAAAQAAQAVLVVLVVHLVQAALLGILAQQETPVAMATIPMALAALVVLRVQRVVQPVNTFAAQAM